FWLQLHSALASPQYHPARAEMVVPQLLPIGRTVSSLVLGMIVAISIPAGTVLAQMARITDLPEWIDAPREALDLPSDSDPFLDDAFPRPTLGDHVRADAEDRVRPRVLRPVPSEPESLPLPEPAEEFTDPLLIFPPWAPLGFSGPSGVLPSEGQTSSHFVPTEDRWRQGMPGQDRYGKGHPLMDD